MLSSQEAKNTEVEERSTFALCHYNIAKTAVLREETRYIKLSLFRDVLFIAYALRLHLH